MVSCTACCIDLMLKDMGKRKVTKKVVEEVRVVTTVIYNHAYVLALMRDKCGDDIIYPGAIFFATNNVVLQSILQK